MYNIRVKRRALGLTMKQLAALVGVTEAAISHYETGRREPDPDMLGRIANALGVTVDYLLGREDLATTVGKPDAVQTMFHSSEAPSPNDDTAVKFSKSKKIAQILAELETYSDENLDDALTVLRLMKK